MTPPNLKKLTIYKHMRWTTKNRAEVPWKHLGAPGLLNPSAKKRKKREKQKDTFPAFPIFLISAPKANRIQGFKQRDSNKRAKPCLFFTVFSRLAAVQFGKQYLGRNLRQTVASSGVRPEIAFSSAFAARALQMVITSAVTAESGGGQRPSAVRAVLIQQVGGGGVFHGLSVFIVSLSLCLFDSLTLCL